MLRTGDVEASENENQQESRIVDDPIFQLRDQDAKRYSATILSNPFEDDASRVSEEELDNYESDATRRTVWSSWFGLRSNYMPSELTRDFCMRERTYMSWVKFFTMLTIISAVMFLDLQIANPAEEVEALLTHTFIGIKQRKISSFTQDLILGSIYFVTAFIAWIVTTYDYFKRIQELESEQIFLDECEGYVHPAMKLVSMLICIIILATVILLLVQRET